MMFYFNIWRPLSPKWPSQTERNKKLLVLRNYLQGKSGFSLK